MTLDKTDRMLVTLLQSHGRLSNRELARRVGLSPSACLTRVRRLETRKVIVGYRAVISQTATGHRMEGLADIRLIDPDGASADALVAFIRATPEVVEAYRTAGQYDYVVRFCAGDFDAWRDLQDALRKIGCEISTRFSVLLEPLK